MICRLPCDTKGGLCVFVCVCVWRRGEGGELSICHFLPRTDRDISSCYYSTARSPTRAILTVADKQGGPGTVLGVCQYQVAWGPLFAAEIEQTLGHLPISLSRHQTATVAAHDAAHHHLRVCPGCLPITPPASR